MTCGCHPDVDSACDLVRGGFSVQTRFGVMHDKTSGPRTESQKEVMHTLRDSYNMNLHTEAESEQANVLTPEFIDEYAIIGMPSRRTGHARSTIWPHRERVGVHCTWLDRPG